MPVRTVSAMLQPRRWRSARSLLVALACGLGLSACGSGTLSTAGAGATASPSQFTAPAWLAALGGDQPQGPHTWAQLNDPANSTLGRSQAVAAAGLARRVTRAMLTGTGTAPWPSYFPAGAAGSSYGRCSEVRVLAASAQRLPVDPGAAPVSDLPGGVGSDPWAKVLVVWTATCARPAYDPKAVGRAAGPPAVSYVYEEDTARGWEPEREWQVPGSATNGDAYVSSVPPSYALAHLSSCGGAANANQQALIEVADAWDAMCAAAARAGVELMVTSALRTPAQQAALFQEAVRYYGSSVAALHWVAYATQSECTSRHCDGAAIDVQPSKAALSWLDAVVGCTSSRGKIAIGVTSCPRGSMPVLRLQRYGFASPLAYEPQYLEFALPVSGDPSSGAAACTPAPSASIPEMIAEIFSCRLADAGIGAQAVRHAVAEAEVVGRCESGWNPDAEAFAGRYQSVPDPANGIVYSQEGVFMLSEAEADAYVPGGYANDTNPIDNINGAAAVYLSDNGWSAFGCATGRSSGFDKGPVLPSYGGPALPRWALTYASSIAS